MEPLTSCRVRFPLRTTPSLALFIPRIRPSWRNRGAIPMRPHRYPIVVATRAMTFALSVPRDWLRPCPAQGGAPYSHRPWPRDSGALTLRFSSHLDPAAVQQLARCRRHDAVRLHHVGGPTVAGLDIAFFVPGVGLRRDGNGRRRCQSRPRWPSGGRPDVGTPRRRGAAGLDLAFLVPGVGLRHDARRLHGSWEG